MYYFTFVALVCSLQTLLTGIKLWFGLFNYFIFKHVLSWIENLLGRPAKAPSYCDHQRNFSLSWFFRMQGVRRSWISSWDDDVDFVLARGAEFTLVLVRSCQDPRLCPASGKTAWARAHALLHRWSQLNPLPGASNEAREVVTLYIYSVTQSPLLATMLIQAHHHKTFHHEFHWTDAHSNRAIETRTPTMLCITLIITITSVIN